MVMVLRLRSNLDFECFVFKDGVDAGIVVKLKVELKKQLSCLVLLRSYYSDEIFS